MLNDPDLTAALTAQAHDIAADALAEAGVTLDGLTARWFPGSLSGQAIVIAATEPGPDIIERCRRANEAEATRIIDQRYVPRGDGLGRPVSAA